MVNASVYMDRALDLAERGRGTTSPNPMVGAVVVREDGTIVGQGYHETAGGPHAEVRALDEAGELARGATLYCTLEPCSHTGRTGPCAVAVAEAGIRRVVAAMQDPFPAVAGNGFAYLRAHGVRVALGFLRRDRRPLPGRCGDAIVEARGRFHDHERSPARFECEISAVETQRACASGSDLDVDSLFAKEVEPASGDARVDVE